MAAVDFFVLSSSFGAMRTGRPPVEDPHNMQVQVKFTQEGARRLDLLVGALASEAPFAAKPNRGSVIRWLVEREVAARGLLEASAPEPASKPAKRAKKGG